MAYRLRSALFLLAPFAWAVACGGDTFGVADEAGTGGGSSDSDTSSDDGYVIPNNCGNEIAAECVVDDDCVGAVDVCVSCYQAGCAAPVAASREDTLTQGCLRTWARRFEGPKDACAPGDVACPAIACEEEPKCPVASCVGGKCQIEVVPGACTGTASGGADGSGSTTGSGGTNGSGGASTGTGGFTTATGGVTENPSGGLSPT